MNVTIRNYYCALNRAEKQSLANKLDISYNRLANGWFNQDPNKRIKPNHEQLLALLSHVPDSFSYQDLIDFYYNERQQAA